jgi:predicted short-subunit dehydrogenase-like oxidoreductase (DUF2520 family)
MNAFNNTKQLTAAEASQPTLGIIGAGRVGGALARTLHERGYHIAAVYSRSESYAAELADAVGTEKVESAAAVADRARLIILTVSDVSIRDVCAQLATRDLSGQAVIHTSGATEVSALNVARSRGAFTGGLHPVWPVARGDRPMPPGGMFGVEVSDNVLRAWLTDLVNALGGEAFWLPVGIDRVRYHAGAVFLSNYLVTLYAEAANVWTEIGIDPGATHDGLIGLVRATIDNLAHNSPDVALTGPIVRGDADTVRDHLSAFDQSDPELAAAYRALGQLTVRLARTRGLSADRVRALNQALSDALD